MLIGPIMLLVVAPALQVVFLGGRTEPPRPEEQAPAPLEVHPQ
jgi:hypothetical protein